MDSHRLDHLFLSKNSHRPSKRTLPETFNILFVEDNPGDVRLVSEALAECPVDAQLTVVKDGVEALRYIRREGQHVEAPRPDLILLDLNLPKKDGRDVLAEIRDDSAFDEVPIVVLSSSVRDEDVVGSYRLHANCYVPKPLGLEEFIQTVKSIIEFWFKFSALPD